MAKIDNVVIKAQELVEALKGTKHHSAALALLYDIEMIASAKRSPGRTPLYNSDDYKRIRQAHADGKSIRSIAADENMSTTTVQKILKATVKQEK